MSLETQLRSAIIADDAAAINALIDFKIESGHKSPEEYFLFLHWEEDGAQILSVPIYIPYHDAIDLIEYRDTEFSRIPRVMAIAWKGHTIKDPPTELMSVVNLLELTKPRSQLWRFITPEIAKYLVSFEKIWNSFIEKSRGNVKEVWTMTYERLKNKV